MNDLDDVLLDEFKERELEILSLMAAGSTNAAIADTLYISKETVRWYNKQIYSKLGTSKRTKAIAKAQRLGLIGSPSPAAPSSTARKHNLPTIATPFMGRERVLEKISSWLAQPHTPLVTLLGPGGMGKSRLAIELGHRLTEQFADGVYLFELAPLTQPDAIAETMMQTLQLTSKGKQSPQEVLLAHCRDKKMLLILDNFEHLLEGATLVDALIKAAPDVRLLVTSRERLNLYGELVHELGGLRKQGAELFVASAKTLRPSFGLREGDKTAVSLIIQLVGGLPLGIILAAAWVDSLSVSEIAEELSQDLDLLTSEMRNLPPRQRSMRTVLAASWQKLSRKEQTVCMKLALFKGGFSRQAAKAVTGASLPLLQKLQHKSFVQRVAERRYDLHPLVHQFGLEKLESSGQQTETQQQHLAFFQKEIAETLRAIEYGDYRHPFEQVKKEHDNVRLALDWGIANGATNVVALVTAMIPYWDNRSYPREAIDFLRQTLALPLEENRRARLLLSYGRFLNALYRLPESETAVREAIRYAESTADAELQLEALPQLCAILYDKANFRELEQVTQRYIDLSQTLNQRQHLVKAYDFSARVTDVSDEPEKSATTVQKALQLARQLENDVLVARFSYNLGLTMLYKFDDREAARQLFAESLALKRLIGDRAGMVSRLSMLATVDVLLGRYEQAQATLAEGLPISEELNLPKRTLDLFNAHVALHEAQEEWAEAIRYAKENLELARQKGYQSYLIGIHEKLARLYLRLNLPQQARHHLRQSVQTALEMQRRDTYVRLLVGVSDYFCHVASYRRSAAFFTLYQRQRTPFPLLKKTIAQLEAQLQTHLSHAEWAALEKEMLEKTAEASLQTVLKELKE